MRILKNICSFILSILIFIITTITVSLIIFNIFINSNFFENTFNLIINNFNEESFNIQNGIGKENSKLVINEYDDNGNYIGNYEIDISDVDLSEISSIIQGYVDQTINYLKNYENSNEKLYFDGNKLINPIINEYEKVINKIAEKENIQINRTELKEEIETVVNQLFNEMNNEVNNLFNDESILISYISNYVINERFIIILIISDILLSGLIILINRNICSVFYIAIPFGLSSLLVLSILIILSYIVSMFILYLIAIIPFLIAIGLVFLFYLIKRNKQ